MTAKKSSAKTHRARRRLSAHERAQRLLGISSSTLTLYSAYLIVVIRLVVILFHSDLPHMS